MSKPDIQQMLEDSQREFEEWRDREVTSGDDSASLDSQSRWKVGVGRDDRA